jgi:predicted GNAT family acetyltransferase
MALAVVDHPDRSRYELRDGDHLLGFSEYEVGDDGVLVFPHTVVIEPKRGAGYGSTLVRGALDDVRRKGATIEATCPFVARYVEEHPEYADLLAR